MTSSEDINVNPELCPLCGKPNGCPMAEKADREDVPCWCASVKISEGLLARVPVHLKMRACICRDCIAAYVIENSGPV